MGCCRLTALMFIIATSYCTTTTADLQPEQIHLAFTGISSERIVNYVTQYSSSFPATVAQYGTSEGKLNRQVKGDSSVFVEPQTHPDPSKERNITIHNVKLTDLEANTKYYYRVGDPANTMSDVFSFSTNENSLTFAVFGDMGYKNAVSRPKLIKDAEQGKYQAVLHVGDLAYDFYEHNGEVGDEFMNSIQPIATAVPYMVLPGNHEHRFNFSHYQWRFNNMGHGVGQTSGSDTSLWYSFDLGLIHFVAFDTEVYDYFTDDGQIARQLRWLEQDLAKANDNRDKVPWIVSLAHKSEFMDKTNFTFISPLLHKYRVDMHFCGHSHNYQRYRPYYGKQGDNFTGNVYTNPNYMTVVVAGSAGSKEKISHGLGPKRYLANSVFDYGYGYLQAVNRTHLHWVWENAQVALETAETDYLWIIQENNDNILMT